MKITLSLLKYCVIASTILSTKFSIAQLPPRDNFNFIFENNFNDDQLGAYLPSDFVTDWNKEPGNRPEGNIKIMNEDGSHQTFMRAYYPTGTISPSNTHGFTWYSYLPTKVEEIYFSYDIRFKPGFNWVHGGKIPGLMGGSVTSGQDPSLNNGFNARMMWKGGGSLVFYVYHYDQTNIYGDTYFWEGFKFTTDKWYNITIRLVLNSIVNGTGIADGILEGYIDGKLFFQKTDFRFRMNEKIKIERMYICSFFGGNTEEWAAKRDEWIDTDNYICYTYSNKASNVPQGNQKNTSGILLHPYLENKELINIPPPKIPESPTQLQTLNLTTSSIELNWIDNSSTEEGFIIERSIYPDDEFTQIGLCEYNRTSFTDKSLQSGILYYYRIKAFNSIGHSDYSNIAGASTLKPEIPDVISKEKIIYIDPLNNGDPNSDGSLDHPFDSWSKVTWKVGYKYLQRRGTTATVETLQISASNIELGSYGEGDVPVIKSETHTHLISGFEKSGIVIRDLELRAYNAGSCLYFLGSSSDSIIVEHCILEGKDNAIKIIDGKNFIARYNTINGLQEGIFSTASKNLIYYNIFESCNNAVSLKGVSSKVEIINNVFTGNSKSISGTYGELTSYNNIFYMTDPHQKALVLGNGKMMSDFNIFYPEHEAFISIDSKSFDNLNDLQKNLRIDLQSFSSDPQFTDINSQNYKLLASSPAINSGKNISFLFEDIAGKRVPLFEKTDIGVHEYDGTLSDHRENNEDVPSLKVYPNPSKGSVTMEIKAPSKLIQSESQLNISEYKVTDLTGKVLLSKNISQSGNSQFKEYIDLSGLNEGLYIIVVILADKIINAKVVLKR